jgi:hypothetical protein
MRALTLAVLKVLGLDELDTGTSPLLGERVCVIHVHVDGSAAHPLRVDAESGEMDCQVVAMGGRIALVMMRSTEAQLLVVGNSPRYIRDHEDRLDTDNASHTEMIRVVVYPDRSVLADSFRERPISVRGAFVNAGAAKRGFVSSH